MKILVSACLLGINCRYNAQPVKNEAVVALSEKHTLIPVCPEQLGGLATPREPAEIRDGRVVTQGGVDVTDCYRRGAEAALTVAEICGCRVALLKERSPSCGSGVIHDGSFSGGLTPGDGVAAALFREKGMEIFGESQIEALPEA